MAHAAAGAQPAVGKGGGGQGRRGVRGEGAELLGVLGEAAALAGERVDGGAGEGALGADLGLVAGAERDDLLVGAAHEVPPHEDVLPERLTAQQQHAQVLVLPGGEGERLGGVGQDLQLAALGPGAAPAGLELDGAAVHEHAVLVAGIEVEARPGAGGEVDLHHGQGRVGDDGARVVQGGAAVLVEGRRAEPHPDPGGRAGLLGGGVDEELAVAEAAGVGQRVPELHAVEHGRVGAGELGVGDAGARDHEVHVPGAHQRVAAQGVTVQDRALEQPGHGREARVRMTGHAHAARALHGIRTEVVHEAPGADE